MITRFEIHNLAKLIMCHQFVLAGLHLRLVFEVICGSYLRVDLWYNVVSVAATVIDVNAKLEGGCQSYNFSRCCLLTTVESRSATEWSLR